MTVFALAGLAEAGLAQAWGIMMLGLLFIGIITLIGLCKWSRVWSLLSISAVVIYSLMFQPWIDVSPIATDDPDLKSFQGSFRSLAYWWIYVTTFSILTLLLTSFVGKKNKMQMLVNKKLFD